MQQNQEQFLVEALHKALQIVETVEDRYREVAFPIILQSFVGFSSGDKFLGEANVPSSNFQAPDVTYASTMHVNEFFRLADPDTHPGRFVTAAYYLFHITKVEQFGLADIVEIYRKLRQPLPKNASDVVIQCIRKGFVTDATTRDKQKCWTITPTGEKYVEGLINGNGNKNHNGNAVP